MPELTKGTEADDLASAKSLKVKLKAGQTVFAQGDDGDAAYILDSGRIIIFQKMDGYTVELGTIEPGDIFGEMAVLDGGKRMASAVAVIDSTVTRIPHQVFERKLAASDRFIHGLILMFVKNIRGSHRIFLRRPRSFRDHVRQMCAFAQNIKRFSDRLEDRSLGEELAETVGRLDGVLSELVVLAQKCADRRHDMILDADELEGIGVKAVIGSENRRRVTAAEAPRR